MKTTRGMLITAAVILTLAAKQTCAQGSLTPPGPPTPAMKTLAQIEPRTPISSLPCTINFPGSYYLTTNLACETYGIVIDADEVDIDLNGYTLSVSDHCAWAFGDNIVMRNGTVAGSNYGLHFDYSCRLEDVVFHQCEGVVMSGGSQSVLTKCQFIDCEGTVSLGTASRATECIISGNAPLQVSVGSMSEVSSCILSLNNLTAHTYGVFGGDNILIKNCIVEGRFNGSGISVGNSSAVSGCSASDCLGGACGITTGGSSVIKDCSAKGNGGDGIKSGSGCTIQNCTANGNSKDGIVAGESCVVTDCSTKGNSTNGIVAGVGSAVAHCTAMSNGQNGISVRDGSTVDGCTLRGNGADGILATYSALIRDNACDVNASNGVHVLNFNSRVENNNLTGNYTGVQVDAGGNVIIRNTARGNWGLGNYSIVGGNDVGPIGQAATATSPWANISY